MSIIDSVLAGLAYGMGATAWFLVYDESLLSLTIGSLCFSIILMAIPYYRLDFFLGRPGVLTDKNTSLIESIIVYFGNLIGIMWIGILMKIFAPHGDHISQVARYVLSHLAEQGWDTVFVVSIFSGMMFYAGAMAVNNGYAPTYFLLISFVCMMAHWPTVHMIFFCLWADTWESWSYFWYLIIPVTLGNIIGSNIWIILRRHSPTYKNERFIKPDSDEADIVRKFHQFVLDNQKKDSNNDNPSDK